MMRCSILLIFCSVSICLVAQSIKNINPRVKIINGEPFYIHTYLDGQSIEQIATAYVSSVAAIEKHNVNLTQITPGKMIKIPYSDASLAAMSQYDLKPDVLSNKAYSDDRSLAAPRTSVTIEEEKALADIMHLSAALKSSLVTLDSAQQKVIEKPVLGDDGLPKKEQFIPLPGSKHKIDKQQLLSEYLEALVQPMLEAPVNSDEEKVLNEFFMVRVSQNGLITNIRDERTKMNNNTMILIPDSLLGFKLDGNEELWLNQFLNIGLVAEVNNESITVKVKPQKIKVLSGEPDQELLQMIRSSALRENLSGKHLFKVKTANYFLALYKQVEYNPFAEIREILYQNSEKRISANHIN